MPAPPPPADSDVAEVAVPSKHPVETSVLPDVKTFAAVVVAVEKAQSITVGEQLFPVAVVAGGLDDKLSFGTPPACTLLVDEGSTFAQEWLHIAGEDDVHSVVLEAEVVAVETGPEPVLQVVPPPSGIREGQSSIEQAAQVAGSLRGGRMTAVVEDPEGSEDLEDPQHPIVPSAGSSPQQARTHLSAILCIAPLHLHKPGPWFGTLFEFDRSTSVAAAALTS